MSCPSSPTTHSAPSPRAGAMTKAARTAPGFSGRSASRTFARFGAAFRKSFARSRPASSGVRSVARRSKRSCGAWRSSSSVAAPITHGSGSRSCTFRTSTSRPKASACSDSLRTPASVATARNNCLARCVVSMPDAFGGWTDHRKRPEFPASHHRAAVRHGDREELQHTFGGHGQVGKLASFAGHALKHRGAERPMPRPSVERSWRCGGPAVRHRWSSLCGAATG